MAAEKKKCMDWPQSRLGEMLGADPRPQYEVLCYWKIQFSRMDYINPNQRLKFDIRFLIVNISWHEREGGAYYLPMITSLRFSDDSTE